MITNTIISRIIFFLILICTTKNKLFCFEIKQIHVIGERCSGTNFVSSLLETNLKNIEVTKAEQIEPYGWKHGYITKRALDHANDNHCLFIHVHRNPYDWIRSFYENPHAAHPTLKHLPFSQWIRSEWQSIYTEFNSYYRRGHPLHHTEMLEDRNPNTGKRFENVIQLRTSKLNHFEHLQKHSPNVISVSYDSINENPENFLKEIASRFLVMCKESYNPIIAYKGNRGTPKKFQRAYQEKKYPDFSSEDLNFINSQLDWELENKLGYKKIS